MREIYCPVLLCIGHPLGPIRKEFAGMSSNYFVSMEVSISKAGHQRVDGSLLHPHAGIGQEAKLREPKSLFFEG